MKVKDVYQYRGKMQDIAKYFGATEQEAEDIAQEAFLKLYKIQQKEGNLNRLEYNNKINMVYLFNMVRNITISVHRKRIETQELTAHDISISDDFDKRERLAEVKEILSTMPPFYRMLYEAYYNDDISLRKLSKETNVSLTTLYYAIKYIKKYVSERLA